MIGTATKPEMSVWRALEKLGIEFEFQKNYFGGVTVHGGLRADFYIPMLNLIIAVQGLYWHYGKPENKAREIIQRTSLESRGTKIIYIDEDDCLTNAIYYVKEALEGRDHSRMRR